MELDDKKQFLSECPPFSDLDELETDQAIKSLSITYHKAGDVLDKSQLADEFCILRSGSLELKNTQEDFVDRLSSGDCFGFHNLIGGSQSSEIESDNITGIDHCRFMEDSLVFHFPKQTIEELCLHQKQFASFFAEERAQRLHNTLDERGRDYRLNQLVSELMIQTPLCTHEQATIYETAQSMSEARVSSILIVSNEQLSGIVTDRDLRSRVLAEGIDPNKAVSSVMTSKIRTIRADQTVYEAQLLMMTANIHHLPVVDEGKPVGIISLNDFIRAQNSEPVFMIQAINRSQNRESLYKISKQLPELICKMIRANVRANEIGRIITSVTDSITRQLIYLATQTFGKPPCEFAWVVFGSQAREDQMLGSDQDNGLILAENAPKDAQEYFIPFARFVNEGLDKSGLKYCPGDVMAMTEKWRQPINTWKQYFIRWIREPDPKALMHASIFYDVRHVAGKRELTQSLIDTVLEEAQKNTIFQACMSENALQSSPPLGFFKKFVLEKDGDHNPVLDLKHRGTVPIVALTRLYCLAHGLNEVNTFERLDTLQRHNVLSASEANNLKDAHEFIASLRLESQSEAIQEGREVSNNLNPNELSPLVRHQLKDAFSVVAESQRLLKMRFGHGAI